MVDLPFQAPRFSTPRRPDRTSLGSQVGNVARVLGHPLMPWQQYAADVALEIDPDTGRLAYSRVSLGVPRRAGKSYLLLCLLLWRTAYRPRQFCWYTAQNGQQTAKLWRQDWFPQVETSPLGPLYKLRASQGSEEMCHMANSSFATAFAPRRDALHGTAGDLIVFDEAWAFDGDQGRDLMQAAGPLTLTRTNGQLWRVSAAGDLTSEWWNDTLDAGRMAAEVDLGHGTCHLEWTAEGLDIDDPDVWAATHPAVGHTVTVEALAQQRDTDPDLFERQYLNITDRTGGPGANPIDPDRWWSLRLERPEPLDPDRPLTLGIDCTPDQTATAIVACTDTGTLEVVDHRPGHQWAVPRLIDLCDRYLVERVVLDVAGPAGVLLAPLEAAGVPVRTAMVRETAAAAGQLVEAVQTDALRHVPSEALDSAVEAGRRRTVGQGAWTWHRRTDADVSPLIAATLARWAHPATFDQYGTVL